MSMHAISSIVQSTHSGVVLSLIAASSNTQSRTSGFNCSLLAVNIESLIMRAQFATDSLADPSHRMSTLPPHLVVGSTARLRVSKSTPQYQLAHIPPVAAVDDWHFTPVPETSDGSLPVRAEPLPAEVPAPLRGFVTSAACGGGVDARTTRSLMALLAAGCAPVIAAARESEISCHHGTQQPSHLHWLPPVVQAPKSVRRARAGAPFNATPPVECREKKRHASRCCSKSTVDGPARRPSGHRNNKGKRCFVALARGLR
jgi:hypothetical protein